jgi:hypothetical protein
MKKRKEKIRKMLKDCHAIMDEKKATRNAIKKRLLRRWKGTCLQPRTLSEMGYLSKIWQFKWVNVSNQSISTSSEPPTLIEKLSFNYSTL